MNDFHTLEIYALTIMMLILIFFIAFIVKVYFDFKQFVVDKINVVSSEVNDIKNTVENSYKHIPKSISNIEKILNSMELKLKK